MKITLKHITVEQLAKNYTDDQEGGVRGYDNQLDIRPPYQREFVYKDAQRNAVIHTVTKGFPLNVMYWALRPDGTFEIIDGQQRTISIAEYVAGNFSVNNLAFHNLTQDQKDQILKYELTVYVCEGTESEKLEWFKTINIAGVVLTQQELRNAVYHGPWLADAKRHFSRTSCAAYQLGSDYVGGTANRQDFLETAIDWISDGNIEGYMSDHQHDANAAELWQHFQEVIAWVKRVFPEYRKEMKGLDWGYLYDECHTKPYNYVDLADQVKLLMIDDDVTKKKGVYAYLLTGEQKHLSLRSFTPQQKREAFERQNGVCPSCNEAFEFADMEGDHIEPWSLGGRTITENCQMLCKPCNRKKSNV